MSFVGCTAPGVLSYLPVAAEDNAPVNGLVKDGNERAGLFREIVSL